MSPGANPSSGAKEIRWQDPPQSTHTMVSGALTGATVAVRGQTYAMRVVSGSARGRRLGAPDGHDTRPTSDRVREAVFNSLYSLGGVEGARVLDLFAGTGAMGIEALSRGASTAVFVETARPALESIRANLEITRLTDRATVVPGDVLTYLRGDTGGFAIAVIDPPYSYDGWDDLLAMVPAELVVIESDREIAVPARWMVHRAKRYGTTVVTLASTDQSRSPRS